MTNLVLKNDVESDCTLLARVKDDGTVYEYVVAWNFQADGTWSQGHYFSDLTEAVIYMDKGLQQKLRLHKLVRVLTDPDATEEAKEEEYNNFTEDYPFFNISRLDVFFK